jgi:ribosomal-protein-alanine N-acetyltransferase
MSERVSVSGVVLLPDGFELVRDKSLITPEEVLWVRQQEPSTEANIELWRKCLDQSLFVAGVVESSTNALVGLGRVVGDQRHAQLVDGTVHPNYRNLGIGEVILDELVDFTQREGIRYVGLTYDKKSPWLKAAYEKHGFESIDFAMWHRNSLQD